MSNIDENSSVGCLSIEEKTCLAHRPDHCCRAHRSARLNHLFRRQSATNEWRLTRNHPKFNNESTDRDNNRTSAARRASANEPEATVIPIDHRTESHVRNIHWLESSFEGSVKINRKELLRSSLLGILHYRFTCLEPTNEIVLHMKDLSIENSSISIIQSSGSAALPLFKTWSYDHYSELIKLRFSSSFALNVDYTMYLTYSANISRDLHGLYISRYVDANGMNRTFMTSQMEPTHARTMFPCVDEPARKAIFYISVQHDPSQRVWANGEIERTETLPDGRILSHFTPTLNMSTFILALIVAPKSDFDCRPDRIVGSTQIRSRVCGRVDILPQLAYADEIAYRSLEFFNTYFDIVYPLPKIEHFAVPDFGAGAMENYGNHSSTEIPCLHSACHSRIGDLPRGWTIL